MLHVRVACISFTTICQASNDKNTVVKLEIVFQPLFAKYAIFFPTFSQADLRVTTGPFRHTNFGCYLEIKKLLFHRGALIPKMGPIPWIKLEALTERRKPKILKDPQDFNKTIAIPYVSFS